MDVELVEVEVAVTELCGSAVKEQLSVLQRSSLVFASVSKYQSGPALTSLTYRSSLVSHAPSGVNTSDNPLAVSELTDTSGCCTSQTQ